MRKRFNQLGAAPGTMTPSEYSKYLNNQTQRWAKLANEGKIDLKPWNGWARRAAGRAGPTGCQYAELFR